MRSFFYMVLLVLLAALQTTLLRHIAVWGVKPDLLLAFVVCVALLDGPVRGSVMGVIAGFLADLISNGLFGFYAITFLYTGLLCGIFSSHFFRRNATATFLFTLIAVLANGLIFFVFHLNVLGGRHFWTGLFTITLPAMAYTALMAVPLYSLVEKVMRMRICSNR